MKSFAAVRRLANAHEFNSILHTAASTTGRQAQTPTVLPGLAANWPALTGTSKWANWSALRDRLVNAHGPLEHDAHQALVVPLEFGGTYMDDSFHTQHVSFLSVLDTLLAEQAHIAQSVSGKHAHQQPTLPSGSSGQGQGQGQEHVRKSLARWYLAQHDVNSISPVLSRELQVPSMLSLSSASHASDVPASPLTQALAPKKLSIYRSNLWLGGHAGTASPCHFDPFHNLLVQVYGTKRVILFDPKDSCGLYPAVNTVQRNTSLIRSFEHDDGVGVTASSATGSNSNSGAEAEAGAGARMNIGNVSEAPPGPFPLYKSVQGFEAILQPGDALYIPFKWWHYCSTNSASCSVNWWYL